mgnify:CR=1 FL=1
MNILIKSSNGITQVSADSKLMSQRKVFIEGEINAETACDFLKKTMRSEAEDSNRTIDIFDKYTWRLYQFRDADL